jgi:DNA helicase-2/ATP-dependent DNA helicase PcrA
MATDLTQEFCALRDTYIEKQFGRLNDMQRQAVFTTDGPLLILAGAGSGKTTVLVNRIANLIRFGSAHGSKQTPRPATEDDIKALRNAIMTGTAAPSWLDGMLRQNAVRSWNVMAITFTNKAAGELKERLRRMLGGEEGDEVFASTFHSACVRILRRWAEEIGYPRSFTIYDTDDSQRVMKAVYKDLNVDDKFLPIKAAINQMSRWKDQLVSPEQALASPAKDTKGALTARIYAAYEKRLKEAGAFDFDDLIYQTVQLLAEHKDVRDFYQNKYRYLLVDEYQDTSVAQFRLVSLLTGPEKNICVVGDDDQSIYRFRGATIENILNFERIYPGTKTIRLEQNYRSTSNILNAANCVIQHNTERKGKTLWTSNGEGDKVQVYTAENEQDEASHIADVIGQHLKEGGHLADHAILYRMNAQSAPIESYFTRAGIPHKIVGGQRFNDRKEVKDIHSYMSIVANPRDDVRLRRIINEPARKIGATTVEVIADLATQEGVSMLDIIGHADQYAKLSRAVMPLLKFWQIYQRLQDSLETRTLDEFAADVIELTGYKAMLEADAAKGHEDAADRLQNLGQLVNNVKNYCDQHGEEATLEGYLEDIALISDIDSYNESADQVVLMTIHSAKGLEFPYVFLIGMEEGVFPSEMSKYSEADLEEERRLAYVGITRAKKELYISNSVWLSSEIITQIVFTLMYYAGVYWLGGAVVSFGVILAMGQYVSRFWQPITNLANIYNSFVNNMAYLERIFETMDEPVVIDDKPNAETLPPITGAVDYNNITFGYEEGQTVLKDVDLHVKAGESIALVGPTGAGKSTIVNLLCRFYDLRSGSITLTDESGVKHDITDVTLHSLRSQMGIMLQDSFIFSGTILDNIRYGRLDATDDEVRQAAAVVRADDFIREMPQGYKTTVNERGGSLSQGQKQLIAFARTLLSDPRILILDEATSSIDTKTEKLLQDGIQALLKGRTSFIIAHRLSTIKNCDRILYIGNQGIMEAGSHDELMAKRGAYYELYTAQARDQGMGE